MHIYEGILAGTTHGQLLLLAGTAATAVGTAIGLRKLDYQRMPQTAVLSAAFFVASLIHVPFPPTSVHLVLNGLLGLVLGWAAFPAVLVALTLQAVFFSFGGLTTLGLNTLVMALPAVICHYAFYAPVRNGKESRVFLTGFGAGASAILLSALLTAAALVLAGKPFETIGQMFLAAHLPLAATEGLVTGSVVVLVRKVRPELLDMLAVEPVRPEVLDA